MAIRRYAGPRRKLSKKLKKELRALKAMGDDDIDFSDIPERTDWSGAIVGRFYHPYKTSLTFRIDEDVLAWLRSGGPGYQTRLNRILRNAMLIAKPLRVIGSKSFPKKAQRVANGTSRPKRAKSR
jgi:uncharacterized protein (DUF4415 family)